MTIHNLSKDLVQRSSKVPGDLVEEILCRVPATNLKRLRATCKGWNRLIKEDRRFQRKHFEKAAKQYRPLLLRNDSRVCSLSVDLHIHREVKIEKLSLVDPRSLNEFDIHSVFHCDGLLVCTSEDRSTLVIWNPCTGETKWIRTGKLFPLHREIYIGYSIDNKSGNKRYKLLSKEMPEVEEKQPPPLIYDIDSDSWRIIDYVTPGWFHPYTQWNISLKGNAYWIGRRETDKYTCLLRFDFSTEKAQPLPLPYQSSWYRNLCLSVVRDDKLCVLVQLDNTSKTEIWVTNKIDDTTKAVSWSMLLALDLTSPDIQLSYEGSFFLDEEKKVFILVDKWLEEDIISKDMLYIVGEDSKVTSVELGLDTFDGTWPASLNYSPSLVQIKPAGGKKRKRAD